ncbi:shikimate kinase [Jatrophihabitans endophyticus]|uniref:Shikimate kinase n=1 Tax=Jatrophihabitans endophyticus TaxID=1206085 RepID=A0A1M5LPQ5_9ACTN|nr:shikimate kinase [Jatrophihabitans endophyticus]SHG66333.1 shikimate kinase [Jatrophihabitans endophyticus]
MTPRAVLVGLPGAGKSTSGRRLAKILGLPFADSDDLVEAAAGRSVAAVFADSGEPGFREVEAAAIASALSDFDGVLALGGGALSTAATRDALATAGVPVVLLRATLHTLTARVGDGRTRPLLAADPPGRLGALAAERDPVYRAVATMTIDTDGRTPGQVAATVAARLHERSRA